MVKRLPVSPARDLTPAAVPAAPVSIAVLVGKEARADFDGEELATLQIQVPCGTFIFYFRRNTAIDVGQQLRAVAKDLAAPATRPSSSLVIAK